MPSTSVHLPADLLETLDRLAAEEKVPRNRIIVEAIRQAIARRARRWPEGYFSGDHLDRRDIEAIRSGAEDFDRRIREERRCRTREPL